MDETNEYYHPTGCSAILARLPDGKIIHGRHVDFAPAGAIRALTYHAEFVENGEVKFEAIMAAGLYGVHTGFKNGKFSISANGRYPGDINQDLISDRVKRIAAGDSQSTELIGKVMMECDDYECAENMLKTEPLLASTYYVMAGTDKGTRITRDTNSVLN